MKKCWIILWICQLVIVSCSDAEVVQGTFNGKMYGADTAEAQVKVTRVNDGIIRLDLTGPTLNGGYVEYAQLRKNAENAYNLEWFSTDSIASAELNGYYYDGYLVFDAWNHQYKFSGGRE